jgi:acyl carrier protein
MSKFDSIVIGAVVSLLEIEDASSVTTGTNLADLGIDSGLMLELFLLIEEKMPNIEIDPAKLKPEHFATVESLVSFVAGFQQEQVA